VGTRLLLFFVAWFAQIFVANGRYPLAHAAARGWQFTSRGWLDIWGRWDAGWYMQIALNGYTPSPGYETVQGSIAFFPLFPMSVRGVLWVGDDGEFSNPHRKLPSLRTSGPFPQVAAGDPRRFCSDPHQNSSRPRRADSIPPLRFCDPRGDPWRGAGERNVRRGDPVAGITRRIPTAGLTLGQKAERVLGVPVGWTGTNVHTLSPTKLHKKRDLTHDRGAQLDTAEATIQGQLLFHLACVICRA
jgi:hypothetical protein